MPAPRPVPGRRGSHAGANHVRILLVNDDPDLLFAMRALLGDLDAGIVCATSGAQALRCLRRHDFALILLDVKMGGMDGFETARLIRMRHRSRHTPIIFTTSHRATDVDQATGYRLGAADYLFMPVPPDILRAKVQTFIDAERSRHEPAKPTPEVLAPSGADPPVSGLPMSDLATIDPPMSSLNSTHNQDFVALLDAAGQWLYASPAYQDEFGVPIRPLTSYLSFVHALDRQRLAEAIAEMRQGESHRHLQYRVQAAPERYFESDVSLGAPSDGAPPRLVVVSRDITERKAMEAYVLHQASHDPLTGLPNRMLLEDRMSQATAHHERLHSTVAVLFIDLDHFKEINDSLGHAAGDRMLQDVAERLSGCVREGDTVARLGGDEFVVMLVGLHDLQDAALVASKIIDTVSETCHIEGSELRVTPSIGIAVYPDDGQQPHILLRNADIAMYHAKREGGARFFFFAAQMHEAASRKLAMGSALQRAIAQGEFAMYYQPKISTSTGAVCGFEALIRWPQDDGSFVPPSVFIPVAEETGRIERIGAWAIRETALQLYRLHEAGFDSVPIAVNVSAMQFKRDNVADSLAEAIREAGIAPALLEVELTESGVMGNPGRSIETLERIRQLGMTIAIDDFGTGYSSLAYLKRLPIDKLKIDASFVRDIATDRSDAAIVMAIATLAHALDLKVIADGVETAAQVDFLTAHGCDELQGFYFSQALPGPEALAFLQRGRFTLNASHDANFT